MSPYANFLLCKIIVIFWFSNIFFFFILLIARLYKYRCEAPTESNGLIACVSEQVFCLDDVLKFVFFFLNFLTCEVPWEKCNTIRTCKIYFRCHTFWYKFIYEYQASRYWSIKSTINVEINIYCVGRVFVLEF